MSCIVNTSSWHITETNWFTMSLLEHCCLISVNLTVNVPSVILGRDVSLSVFFSLILLGSCHKSRLADVFDHY